MTRQIVASLMLVPAVLSLMLAGCRCCPLPTGGEDADATQPVAEVERPQAPEGGVVSNAGRYYVVHRVDPDPIPLNEPFSVQVWVYDAADRSVPLTDIDFAIDGRMPEHRHGMTREPKITRNADGSFTVSGMLFHMPGFWELHFDILRDGQTERAQVDVILD